MSLYFACSVSAAQAGGGRSVGLIEITPTVQDLYSEARRRHAIGVEYVRDNPEVQRNLSGLIQDILVAGSPASIHDDLELAVEINAAVMHEVERVKASQESGLDFMFWTEVIRTGLELGLRQAENTGVAPKGINMAVGILKVSVAAATAYSYGYLVGGSI